MLTGYHNKQAAISVVCHYDGKTRRGVFSLTEFKLARKCARKWGPGRLHHVGVQRYEWVRDGSKPKE
jgi:ribosomal protein S14